MTARNPIFIIGGGLAGLTLGIGLRRQGVPVTIIEAGHYPRHRVCGEFVNGRGQQVLETLGLREIFLQAGAISAKTAALFSVTAQSPLRPLEPPGLCLSRFEMDAVLADRFRSMGGELREGERVGQLNSDERVVRATGRRVQPLDHGWRWFGLKVHARRVVMAADLEMHLTGNGYVGLCRLTDGVANVCGLFRSRAGGENSGAKWKTLLSGTPGSPLSERFEGAIFDEASFCSVAGLPLRPKLARDLNECCIGDALTMTPPVTGNGMSMAFESAEMAIAPLTAYHRGEQSWVETRQAVARACDAAFVRRLAWAACLQWMMFAPIFREGLAKVALRPGWLWRLMFDKTR